MSNGKQRGVIGLLFVGVVLGIIFWGGFNTAMEATNTEQFCISWPGKSVLFGTYTLYNRWGAPVQSGSHDQVCTPLNDLPADVYVLVLTLPDGSVWTTRLTIL